MSLFSDAASIWSSVLLMVIRFPHLPRVRRL
jgi:hypothetical protein